MTHPILGLHHVTATVDDAQDDLDLCLDTLGLRLVKKTVNFDNHNVYHFYYGDQRGTPGTIWTTFPYKGWGVPVGEKGAGQIVATSFSVPMHREQNSLCLHGLSLIIAPRSPVSLRWVGALQRPCSHVIALPSVHSGFSGRRRSVATALLGFPVLLVGKSQRR